MGTDMKKADDWSLNYCWITSTYTLDIVGIQEEMKENEDKRYTPEAHEKVYHSYYQWVPFVLFGMGCFFYLPHIIWKLMEGKRVEKLLQGLNRNSILAQSTEKVENIVKYIQASKGLNGHYFYYYMGTEVLNLVNVVVQMCLLDKFIGGQFWQYGIKSLVNLLGDETQRQDPMINTFPRITKCKFSHYGTSGTIEHHDLMCLLPQNILNEKIFLIIWLWFVILTTITASYVVMRLVLLLTPILNEQLPENLRLTNNDNSYDIQNCEERMELQSIGATSNSLPRVPGTMSFGDSCLLELLQENLDYATFQAILKGLQ